MSYHTYLLAPMFYHCRGSHVHAWVDNRKIVKLDESCTRRCQHDGKTMFTFLVCFTHKIPRFLTTYRNHKHPLPSIFIYLCESVRAGIQQFVSLSKSIVFQFLLRQKMVEQYLLDGCLISIPNLLKIQG